ncbi:MAG: hypothetical protein IPJ77_20680 [Planctomycetes bacterium]|nr:hypothetical protein [Planctomycetota bacterium]
MTSTGIAIGFCLLGGGLPASGAGPGASTVELQATRYVVDAVGARTTERGERRARELVTLAPTGPGTAAVQLPSGALWSRDESLYWIGKVVSLGDHGTQVFTEFDSGVDHAEFLSGFDQTPATPVWQTTSALDLAQAACDSAETNDIHVTLHQVVTNGDQMHRQPVVALYSSSSPVPDWTWSFPVQIGGASKVAMSRDGQVIVAAIQNNYLARVEIAVFTPASSTPVSYTTLPSFVQLRGFDLSADGSTLYLSSPAQAYLFDTATHTVTHQIGLPTSLECHAISGDGRVFAFGTFGTVELFEKSTSGTWAHTYTRTVPGTCVCSRIDLSDDGSTLAYGFNFYDTNLHVRIEALDVATKQVTTSDDAYGAGTLQNIVSDVSISADGSRFAVGLWGDEGNTCPELRFYSKHGSAPSALFNLPGSVFDVDLSADGERVAVASKAVHANTFASGGRIALYAFARQDLRAQGVPVAGGRVAFQLAGPANSSALLLWSDLPAQQPTEFGNIGTLYLRRTALNAVPMGMTSASGEAAVEFSLPGDASDVGRTFYFQGFCSNPRRLTSDWITLTVLP